MERRLLSRIGIWSRWSRTTSSRTQTRSISHSSSSAIRSGKSHPLIPQNRNRLIPSFDSATTHADLLLRADALKIPVFVIHNASVMNAVGAVGLALYNYGQTVSIPFFTETWNPDSWLDRIRENMELGLHTLCLLDIKVKEQSEENLARFVFTFPLRE